MELDLETCTLLDVLRLQEELSEVVRRRFTRPLALCFTDVVGSTAYLARFGDESSRRLHQRHVDELAAACAAHEGRIVDTAGDGAFSCFPAAATAARALADLFERVREDNAARPRAEALRLRASLHWGPTITDGAGVSGEAVHLAARLGELGSAGEVRLTREALRELPNDLKLRARRLPPTTLHGFAEPVESFALGFEATARFPVAVRVEETGARIALPACDTVTFGRLADAGEVLGNDIVLAPADPAAAERVSRFHFELRRRSHGYALRAVSNGVTEVDGRRVAEGSEVAVAPGSVIRVAGVLTLTLIAAPEDDGSLATVQPI